VNANGENIMVSQRIRLMAAAAVLPIMAFPATAQTVAATEGV
jgi:hypothetical protein